METATLNVQGMTCNHCVQTVKGSLGKINGVKSVEVTLEKGLVNIVYDPATAKPGQFKTAIVEAGYEVAG